MVIRAKRHLAQHFLESAWVDRVVAIVAPQPHETFLEVGAGRGALTPQLAARAAHVVAVEIDRQLVAKLRRVVPTNVTVVAADFLNLDLDSVPELCAPGVRVAGNLPYNVGSAIVLRLLTTSDFGQRLPDATVMLQREVADRVTAVAGSRDWGPLAVRTALHADASQVLTLPPGAFRPMPKVRSALVRLRFRPAPVVVRDLALLDQVVRAMFTQRRKQVSNALRPILSQLTTLPAERVLELAGIDPQRRPAELGLAELAELSEVLASARR